MNIKNIQQNKLSNELFSLTQPAHNQPLGSIPREANSLRIILLIQAEILPSPSCSTAFSIAERNSGSNLNWNGGLPTLFLSFCIDISSTPILLFICTDILHTVSKKSKRPLMFPALKGVLTNNLTKDKTMANPNNTPYTAQGASKIYLFLGIPRSTYRIEDRQMLRIEADNPTQARAALARDYVLIPCGRIAKFRANQTACNQVKGGIYA